MLTNIFVYGTLLCDEVVKAVTGKTFSTVDYKLDHYQRFQIYDNNKPRMYPGIIPVKDSSVMGKILLDVDEESFSKLCHFEDSEYVATKINCLVFGKRVICLVFLWTDASVLRGAWDIDFFKKEYLETYVTYRIPQIMSSYKEK
jgi:gamma-glutamylcyclotransferase (GGCT)/AIG2-like uncharacterized protein YtfP